MAPGFDQICMSRPRIIYLDLALQFPSLFPTSARRVASHRGWIRVEGAFWDHRRKPTCTRRQREKRERARMEDARRERGEGRDGRYVSTEYAGTLTPPDYPMNRNVIYGSFSVLEGWRESCADRAIVYNTSRHIAIPKLILSANMSYDDAILLCMISLLRDYIYYMNVFTIYLTRPITFMLHRDPSNVRYLRILSWWGL